MMHYRHELLIGNRLCQFHSIPGSQHGIEEEPSPVPKLEKAKEKPDQGILVLWNQAMIALMSNDDEIITAATSENSAECGTVVTGWRCSQWRGSFQCHSSVPSSEKEE